MTEGLKLFVIITNNDTQYWTPAYQQAEGFINFAVKQKEGKGEILHKLNQNFVREIKGPFDIRDVNKEPEKPTKV
jgi:hypothetical protein